jgi:hypothetical protein
LRIASVVGAALASASEASAQSSPEKLLVGDTKIETISSYKGVETLPKPGLFLIYDFTVPPDVITTDEFAAARLRQRHRPARGSEDDASPEQVAEHVRASVSKTLQSELQKASVSTELAAATMTDIPVRTLVVHGEFTAVNEGGKPKPVVIGFGQGASDVQAHVTVTLTTESQAIVLSEFKMKSESSKKTGAAATMGASSAATGVATGDVGDKNATVESDASRMAKAVAKQIEQVMAAQKWIVVPQT